VLTGPDGKSIDPIYGYGRPQGPDATSIQMEAWFPLSGSGTYTLAIPGRGSASEVRTIIVP
jgi:hypothetical protein